MSDDVKICSICFQAYTEYGNSAEPINNGRCCNRCTDEVVIPARIRAMRQERIRAMRQEKEQNQHD